MSTFGNSAAARLDDREYFDFVLASIESARRRIWASLFIYDIRPSRDLEGLVLELTTSLIQRHALGVDVRVMTSGGVTTPDIAVSNLASGLYLQNAGVPHRRIFASGGARMGSHAKYLIVDNVALLGSQNWTDDGFRLNLEDAAVLRGQACDQIAHEFLGSWNRGKGMPQHATQ